MITNIIIFLAGMMVMAGMIWAMSKFTEPHLELQELIEAAIGAADELEGCEVCHVLDYHQNEAITELVNAVSDYQRMKGKDND